MYDACNSRLLYKVQWSNVKEFEVFPTDSSVYAAKDGESHFYAECSGKGECDREAGECKCYNGYTGSACQRSKYISPFSYL